MISMLHTLKTGVNICRANSASVELFICASIFEFEFENESSICQEIVKIVCTLLIATFIHCNIHTLQHSYIDNEKKPF